MSVPLTDRVLAGIVTELSEVARRMRADLKWTETDRRTLRLMAPQEIVDVIAFLAGVKPLYLIRGFGQDSALWIEAIGEVAARHGCRVILAPGLIGDNPFSDAPPALQEHSQTVRTWTHEECVYHYVVADRAIEGRLRIIQKRAGQTTIPEEAALLGYPPCCVKDYYVRMRRIAEVYTAAAMRATAGDPDLIRGVDSGLVTIEPTLEENAVFEEGARQLQALPFTSVNACPTCWGSERSPGRRLSKRLRTLITRISPGLAHAAETTHQEAHGESGTLAS